jgi:hypothetical protein
LANIFVSYTSTDSDWAFWIGQELDALGYAPRVHEWEISGGGDIAAWMERAHNEAEHILCVVSRAYLEAPYSSWERRAAQWAAAKDRPGFVLPVFVEDCKVPTLFSQIKRCNLLGITEADARARLARFLEPATKPAQPQPFPGSAGSESARAETAEATAGPANKPMERQPFPGGRQAEAAKAAGQYALVLSGAQTFFGTLMGQTFLFIGLISIYLAAEASLYSYAKTPLSALRGDLGAFWFWIIHAVPLACILLFVMLPLASRALREKRLRAMAIGGVPKPGYFRLQPYGASDHDAFNRLDGADREVLKWLKSTKSSLLYLSGASGVGKSSLLSAAVLPELRDAGWTVVETRMFGAPVEHLRKALVGTKGLFKRKPADTLPLAVLLRSAAEAATRTHAAPLFLVVDQFEEFLILHDEAARAAFASLLSDLAKSPIDGLKLLPVFRSDYRPLVFKLDLPPLTPGENWYELAPYDRSKAASMLQGGGRELSPGALDALFRGLDRIEDAPGLYRPITLNMIGLVLERMGGTLHGDPSKLIQTYLTDSLIAGASRDFVKQVLGEMITEAGTKEPHTEAELVDRTHFEHWQVRATLADLARRGLVRRLEGAETTWEIAHDFLARTIGQLIGRLKPTLVERARPLVAPVVLLGWVAMLAVAMPYWRLSQQQAAEEALRADFGAIISGGKPRGISVSLPGDADDLKLAGAARFLEPLDELTVKVSSARITNLEPLRGLTSLKTLILADAAGITSLEPLRDLTHLETLHLYGTGITSLEPIRGLTHLETLHLYRTGITSLEPIRGLTHLETLDLYGTGITSLEPLRDLTSLKTLDLSKGIASLEPIRGLTQLETLHLDGTGITSLEPLTGLTSLQRLDLTRVEGITSLEPLRGLTSLDTLDLTSAVGITSLEPLRGLTSLTSLNLYGTGITSLEPLKGLTSLTSLNLYGTGITSLEPLRGLTSLTSLNLYGTGITSLEPLNGMKVFIVGVSEELLATMR